MLTGSSVTRLRRPSSIVPSTTFNLDAMLHSQWYACADALSLSLSLSLRPTRSKVFGVRFISSRACAIKYFARQYHHCPSLQGTTRIGTSFNYYAYRAYNYYKGFFKLHSNFDVCVNLYLLLVGLQCVLLF